jgi:glucose/mannose-6-phosphate isomerase
MSSRLDGGAARMLTLVQSLPDQLAASGRLPGLDSVRRVAETPRRVLLCGMGGSAIAGDLAGPLLASLGLPLVIWRDYGLPVWADDSTLVIASSYSGSTEEVLSAVTVAQERRCRLIAVTSGGELQARAGPAGSAGAFPVVLLPEGLPPRAAVGYSIGALLWCLHNAGLLPSPEEQIAAACAVLRAGNAQLADPQQARNPALALVPHLQGRFVVIYTTSPEAGGAGLRLKTQLNENAKCPAYAVAFPELNHNDIVGWQLAPERRAGFALLVLRSGDEGARTRQRVAITQALLRDQFAAIKEIHPQGDAPLARVLSLVQFGDYLSCYLAAATGVDPVPIERIAALKDRLRKEDPA